MKSLTIAILGAAILFWSAALSTAADVTMWCPPAWKNKADQARSIAETLGEKSGHAVKPRIAKNCPEILTAFAAEDYSILYVESFLQAVIKDRELGVTLARSVNGQERYSAIIGKYPGQTAFTLGASSGESSAMAATGGEAAMGVPNHMTAAKAVAAGKAKAAVVRNRWLESKDQCADFEVSLIPGIPERKNPDNVRTASKNIPAEITAKIREAAIASADVFGAKEMRSFDEKDLQFSLELRKKGGIDPATYAWVPVKPMPCQGILLPRTAPPRGAGPECEGGAL